MRLSGVAGYVGLRKAMCGASGGNPIGGSPKGEGRRGE